MKQKRGSRNLLIAAAVVLNMSIPLIEILIDPWSVFFVMAANALP